MKYAEAVILNPAYSCWMNFETYQNSVDRSLEKYCHRILNENASKVVNTAAQELCAAIKGVFHFIPQIVYSSENLDTPYLELLIEENNAALKQKEVCGFTIKRIQENNHDKIVISGMDENGVLYGVFQLLFALGTGKSIDQIDMEEKTYNKLRMINHWDNLSGDIERGYSGKSIFYENNTITRNYGRIRDYARLLSSVGINCISLNNVNVHDEEAKFITNEYLLQIAPIVSIFSEYGIKILLCIDFASPIFLGGLDTADPLNEAVQEFWRNTADVIYSCIPDFGGFLVKADSESTPGPYTYGRDHTHGANMLADALQPHGGIVVWRCFVYDCHTDWRDRKLDRAKAAYENFIPLDGKFEKNVILQIKNGPMDFQIREPVNPLFGSLEKTNQVIEFQIAQEYTGHQIDLCFLVPLWKEALDFDTTAKGKPSFVRDIVNGQLFHTSIGGVAGVSNIGNSPAWTGNPLAQANLFGFGRLAWNPELTSANIAEEWAKLTFGSDHTVISKITDMLLRSRGIYEEYTCPLGIGWFVNPQAHYGPNVDGYEYSRWGTYHYADINGIGVDRTVATGTGYAGQYRSKNARMYEQVETCPEDLLLFFHHMPYHYVLKSGLTILQHIYDTHFKGVEGVKELQDIWNSLQGRINPIIFQEVQHRLALQMEDAVEWRDVVNTYFYRKTGIPDEMGRYIYP